MSPTCAWCGWMGDPRNLPQHLTAKGCGPEAKSLGSSCKPTIESLRKRLTEWFCDEDLDHDMVWVDVVDAFLERVTAEGFALVYVKKTGESSPPTEEGG